jgi:hypothetical protein
MNTPLAQSARLRALQRASVRSLPQLVISWLPTGRRVGNEWVALNPRRTDRSLGSFKVNLQTGRWADFATGEAGGDAISLLAYLRGVSQGQAARLLARELNSPL